MEAASFHGMINNTINLSSSSSSSSLGTLPRTRNLSIPPTPAQQGRRWRQQGFKIRRPLAAECIKEGPGPVGEEEEWMDKCGGESKRGSEGIVEIMECLEREAIMGEDEGRDPSDYHRRAHIFHHSSRIFQALKEHTNTNTNTNNTTTPPTPHNS